MQKDKKDKASKPGGKDVEEIAAFKLDQSFVDELEAKAHKEYPTQNPAVIKKILKNIAGALDPAYYHLLTVCNAKSGKADIDVAILRSLLKANNKGDNINENEIQIQLRLALKWNRIDIARNFILTEENKEKVFFFSSFFFQQISCSICHLKWCQNWIWLFHF